jgi:hypothetical protein
LAAPGPRSFAGRRGKRKKFEVARKIYLTKGTKLR